MQLRFGCDFTNAAGPGGSLADCLAVQLNDLIAQNMADGLGFSGLSDLSDVAVVLGFYSVASGEQAPDRQCLPTDLFACAGLTERVDKTYDITCASCTDGAPERDPTSSVTVAPCIGQCFIENCYALVAAGGG